MRNTCTEYEMGRRTSTTKTKLRGRFRERFSPHIRVYVYRQKNVVSSSRSYIRICMKFIQLCILWIPDDFSHSLAWIQDRRVLSSFLLHSHAEKLLCHIFNMFCFFLKKNIFLNFGFTEILRWIQNEKWLKRGEEKCCAVCKTNFKAVKFLFELWFHMWRNLTVAYKGWWRCERVNLKGFKFFWNFPRRKFCKHF